MKHKIFRALLSLVLVCVLLIGLSPIRARAMMPVVGWDGFAWNLSEIIASGAIGIGTSPGAVPDDWNIMIENAKQACQDFFGFVGDTMKIYRFFDGSSYKYYAKADFVEWLRDWLWSSSSGPVLSYDFDLPDNLLLPDKFSKCYATASSYDYAVVSFSSSGYWGMAFCDYKPFVVVDNSFRLIEDSGDYTSFYYFTHTSYNSNYTTDGLPCYDSAFYVGQLDEKSVCPVDGFVFNHVGFQNLTIGDAYPEWVQNSVYIPAEVAGTEEEVLALPLGLGQTLGETQALTQEQIWAGESTLQVEIDTEAFEGTVSMTPWETFKQWMSGIWTSVTDSIISVKEAVLSIPAAIADVIADIFIPSEDFLTVKFEAIRAEFAFADSIMTSGDMVLDVLNGIDPEPPVIYIDLGASEGSYDIGGEVPFLDLRWYERYKPTGDAIISAFLWLVFVWRMFIKLPGIIGGLPGDFVMQGAVNLGLSEHLPARKKEYEHERQQNRRSMRK